MIAAPSPNHGARRGVVAPDMAVLHFTAMSTAEAAVERLRDPAAEVSCHWLIAEDGRIFQLVDETRRAWHAGLARWGGAVDVNSRSIGIELANDGAQPFPEPQMTALERLLDRTARRWAIPPERVIGHEDCAPVRKRDPGVRFDWRRLALGGRAVWLDGAPEAGAPADPAAFAEAGRRFGYPVEDGPDWIAAFRRRFRPWEAEQAAAPGAAALAQLRGLAARWPVAD